MAVGVQVPVGGEGAEDYVLMRWYAAEGDRVAEGEALFELETAKATYDVPAPADGVLTIMVTAGAEVSAHQMVGTIGDGVVAYDPVQAARPADQSDRPTPADRPGRPPSAEQQPAALSAIEPARPDRVVASPRARMAARAAGADLVTIAGTGPGGRVLARDVPTAPASIAASPAGSTAESAPVRQNRAMIARRMTEAAAIPTVTLHRWCEGTVLRDVVSRLRTHAERWDLPKVSVGDVLAAVVARVLPRHPDLNAHWVGGVRRHESVHLGIAVDAPWGLVVPVVRDAQRLPVGELSATLADLAVRARARTVGREEITGSTFTITNLGPTGVEHFTPLLNPPEVAILGVGALVPDRAAAVDAAGVRLPLSLTFDHRAVDGAPAGRFLADVAAGIEAADVVLVLGEARPHENRSQEGESRP